MNDLHRTTDRFTVRTGEGRRYEVLELTPQHEARRGDTTEDLGIKNPPRLQTAEGLTVVARGDDEYDIITPDGRVVARRE